MSTACMTLAYIETMKAVSLTGSEKPDSMMAARLIVEIARRGERDPDRLCNAVLILMNTERQARRQIVVPPASERALDWLARITLSRAREPVELFPAASDAPICRVDQITIMNGWLTCVRDSFASRTSPIGGFFDNAFGQWRRGALSAPVERAPIVSARQVKVPSIRKHRVCSKPQPRHWKT
jgi:hypothetical protein